jgi:large subunit ribosomal protein L22
MVHFGYSYKKGKEKYAAAQAHDVDASFKDLGAVCDAIRFKKAKDSLELLEKASKAQVPILFRKHNKRLGHRHELGGKKGRYPKKSARIVMGVLRNAVANAAFKGMDDDLFVVHACANKQRIMPRMAPRGKSRKANYETAIIEVVVEESRASKKSFDSKKAEAAAYIQQIEAKDKFVKDESAKLQTEVKKLLAEKKEKDKAAKQAKANGKSEDKK